MRDDVDELLELLVSEHTAEQLAEALHKVVIATPEVCSAFNAAVDRRFQEDLKRQGLRPVSLRRLATKNEFGAN